MTGDRSGSLIGHLAAPFGDLVASRRRAAEMLESEGIDATVLNMSTVRPLDKASIVEAAGAGPILTVEEHTEIGGLGSAVAEVVVSSHPTRMRMLGIPGEFAPTGSASFIFEHFGLTPEGIRKAARQLLQESVRVTQ